MNKKVHTLILSAFAAVLLVGFVVYEGTKASVKLVVDEEEKMIRTHANTVGEFLEDQNIFVREEDHINQALETEITDGIKVAYEAAKPIKIVMNDQEKMLWTTAETVRDVIHEQNIALNQHDQVMPAKETKLEEHLTIKIKESIPIQLNVAGEEQEVWTTSTTVADLLKQQDISLKELDRVEPGLEESLEKDSIVKVVRIEKVTDVVEEPVDYAVVTRKDSSLTTGQEKVIEQGKKGLVKKHYEVILENGKEVSRELIETEKVKDSKEQIVAVGTKPIQTQVSRSDAKAVKEFYVKATAYTAYCNGCSGTTRTGINLRKNPDMKVIAVDPRVIPLGTKVWVEGYGYAIAADTGGAIKGNRIDLFIPNKRKVDAYGIKTVKIKILE